MMLTNKGMSAGRIALYVVLLQLTATTASATAISYTGILDPDDPNDVFIATFALAAPNDVTIQSYGYGGSASAPGGTNAAGAVIAPGGFDTYLSLFSGIGPSATFLVSNDDGACPPAAAVPLCRDSTLNLAGLPTGSYTIVLSVFDNFSFAENLGAGTLADGFIGLGSYFDASTAELRASSYALDVVTSAAPTEVPEPGTLLLLATGVTFAALRRSRWRR